MSDTSREENTRQARHARQEKRNQQGRVFTYLAILFAAAFVLLLMAYFMQQRTSEQTIGTLKASITSIQSLDELIEENQALREENRELENALEYARSQYQSSIDQQKKTMSEVTEKTHELASWEAFFEADQLFRDNMYTRCADLLRELAQHSYYATPPGAEERAREIYETLVEKGYLTAEEEAVL